MRENMFYEIIFVIGNSDSFDVPDKKYQGNAK